MVASALLWAGECTDEPEPESDPGAPDTAATATENGGNVVEVLEVDTFFEWFPFNTNTEPESSVVAVVDVEGWWGDWFSANEKP